MAEILHIRYAEALGLLGCLWTWAAKQSPNGDLKRFSDNEISHAARWEGDQGLLRESLKTSELVTGKDRIHDWKKHGIRLLNSSKKRIKEYREKGGDPKGWFNIRLDILKRDRGICGYCAKKAYVVDHIYPISRGGTSDYRNLIASCKSCNWSKGGKTIDEAKKAIIDDKMKQLYNSYVTTLFNSTNLTLPNRTLPNLTVPKESKAFKKEKDKNVAPAEPSPMALKPPGKSKKIAMKARPYWQQFVDAFCLRISKEKGFLKTYQPSSAEIGQLAKLYDTFDPAEVLACWDMAWERDRPWSHWGSQNGRAIGWFSEPRTILTIMDDKRYKSKAESYRQRFGLDAKSLMSGIDGIVKTGV